MIALHRWSLVLLLWFANSSSSASELTSLYNDPTAWKDETGSSVTFPDWKGRRLVVTMAYTSCRMSCPLTMRRLKRIEKKLAQKKIPADFVFVSLDPRVDTPKRLAYYKKSWGIQTANWHFLASDQEKTKRLSDFLKIRFEEIGGHIDHDNTIVLISSAGQVVQSIQESDETLDVKF